MTEKSSNARFEELRSCYPVFTYEDFSWQVHEGKLELHFHFHINNEFHFRPVHRIDISRFSCRHISTQALRNTVFHIGLIELISYWKASCAPRVHIRPRKLNAEQMQWWKKLYFHGLGEFFYLNGIDTDQESFLEFTFDRRIRPASDPFKATLEDACLIPVGGGKDSVVTLNLLSPLPAQAAALVINQREATRQCIATAGLSDHTLEIERTIDPLLIELNNKGFLNGHTPFSALLAFESILAALITRKRHIVLSNESSANEATIPGTLINHQYSKSFDFEQDFRWYINRFMCPEINYFSFLRPLNELQIGALFAGSTAYHKVFRSCNVGSKTDSWCCNCPKCLFTWIMLAPFLPHQQLIDIFGQDLWQKESLRGTLMQLSGLAAEKPFECVGTIAEVNASLEHMCRQFPAESLPLLLSIYHESTQGVSFASVNEELRYWNTHHNLRPSFAHILTDALEKVKLNA